jgi:hypothetical protein
MLEPGPIRAYLSTLPGSMYRTVIDYVSIPSITLPFPFPAHLPTTLFPLDSNRHANALTAQR